LPYQDGAPFLGLTSEPLAIGGIMGQDARIAVASEERLFVSMTSPRQNTVETIKYIQLDINKTNGKKV
jgi:hypothetical protein